MLQADSKSDCVCVCALVCIWEKSLVYVKIIRLSYRLSGYMSSKIVRWQNVCTVKRQPISELGWYRVEVSTAISNDTNVIKLRKTAAVQILHLRRSLENVDSHNVERAIIKNIVINVIHWARIAQSPIDFRPFFRFALFFFRFVLVSFLWFPVVVDCARERIERVYSLCTSFVRAAWLGWFHSMHANHHIQSSSQPM